MPDRKPFVFGVGFILDSSELRNLLHQQFNSDRELEGYLKFRDYEVDFNQLRLVYDANSGVVVESVGVNKWGELEALTLLTKLIG